MSSEKTFCLFKNVSVDKDGDYVHVYGQDICCSADPEDSGKSSLNGSRAGFIEELRNLGKRVVLLLNIPLSRSILQIFPHDLLLDRLCSIFTKPFLLIQCKEALPPSNEDGITTLEKRLDLTKMLEYSLLLTWIDLFSFEPNIERCTVDITLGWEEPPPEVMTNERDFIQINFEKFMLSLYEKDDSKDLTIVSGNGAEIRCHRILFQVHSDVLSAMISPNNGMKEGTDGRIEMIENSEEGLILLIRYLYGMKLKIDELSCDVAIELFKTAHKYKLEEILKWLGEILVRKGSDWYTPDDLLEIYFHVKNLPEFKPIEEYILCIMLSLSKELRACERLKELKRTDPEAAFGLMSVLFDMK